jgi:F0F1-type ATP synthase membrane subunit c/vacuolar-type H+-ATPase subunit K
MSNGLKLLRSAEKAKKGLFLVFLTLVALLIPRNSFAQEPILGTEAALGVARLVDINEENVKDGAVVATSEEGPILANKPYDGHVIGVVARDAAIIISSSDITDGLPVIQNGQVYILVSSRDGAIEKGDLLTTSTIPGVAVRANQSGYVLGSSLEDYDNSDPEKIEKIVAELDLHYFNSKPTFPGSLSDIFKIAILSTDEGPDPLFKYIVAALVAIGSFVLGYMTFSRTAAKGVEALGRNPSAKATIHLGIIFNVAIVVIIIITGLTVAFLILRL